MEKSEESSLVMPGESLCVIEEFEPGPGAYEGSDGKVYSQVVGVPVYDLDERIVKVEKLSKKLSIPEIGDVVLARVIDVKSIYAAVKIFEVEGKPPLTGLFSGILHISQVSTSFVRTLYDVVRIGDIIRAQVLNRAPLYQISIRGREFGVVYALCSECLTPLVLRSLQLFCPKCRRVEKRKVAFSYYMVRRSSA